MTDKDYASHTTPGSCDIMFLGMRKCFRRSAPGRWSPYWLDDLHVPHRGVGSNSWPVWELLVSGGFTVEAVGEGAQLETVSIWEEMAATLEQEGKWNKSSQCTIAGGTSGGGGSRNLRLFFFHFHTKYHPLFIHCIHLRAFSPSSN